MSGIAEFPRQILLIHDEDVHAAARQLSEKFRAGQPRELRDPHLASQLVGRLPQRREQTIGNVTSTNVSASRTFPTLSPALNPTVAFDETIDRLRSRSAAQHRAASMSRRYGEGLDERAFERAGRIDDFHLFIGLRPYGVSWQIVPAIMDELLDS